MLGVYDYTVILTYLSAISAMLGVFASTMFGEIGPYISCLCLLLCGLLDAFDGKVARTKKNRSDYEKKFGIQIDSLTDLLAFGVLPSCIGFAMLVNTININEEGQKVVSIFKYNIENVVVSNIIITVYTIIMVLYSLEALIRLSNFNVIEEERQSKETVNRTYFKGVPVTTSCFIFPVVMLIQYITSSDISIIYFVVLAILGLLFILDIKIPKMQTKGIIIISVVSVVILVLVLLKIFVWNI